MPAVVFAAPFFSDNAKRFIEAVAGLPDVRLGLISQEPWEHLPQPLQAKVAAYWRVDDALDASQLVHATQGLGSRLGEPVHRLLGVIEQIQVPIAEARERLGIAGMRAEQAMNFRDKARMKELLRAAGLPCARHRLIATEADAFAFVEQVGYPIIVKPPAGAASQSTFRVDSADSLREALRASSPGAWAGEEEILLEEFVTGDEHSFDAFCRDGRILFHSLTHYLPSPLDVVRNPWIQWAVLLPREIDEPTYDDIRETGARALEVLGLENGMCHMEWFRRRDGSIAISEVAARPPGAQITTLISRAHDFDSVTEYARLMIFGEFNVPKERKYAAGGAYLRGQGQGRVRAVHGLDQVQRELGALVTDAKLPYVGQERAISYEGEGYILIRHPETAVVRDALTRIVSTVRVELGHG